MTIKMAFNTNFDQDIEGHTEMKGGGGGERERFHNKFLDLLQTSWLLQILSLSILLMKLIGHIIFPKVQLVTQAHLIFDSTQTQS